MLILPSITLWTKIAFLQYYLSTEPMSAQDWDLQSLSAGESWTGTTRWKESQLRPLTATAHPRTHRAQTHPRRGSDINNQ